MGKILLAKPGAVDKQQKETLKQEGYIVIEVADTNDVKVLSNFSDLERDDLLQCAIQAMGYGNDETIRLAFAKLFREAVIKKLKEK